MTALRRCEECKLQFRIPTTTSRENKSFYQTDYRQGFDSDVPDPDKLENLLHSKFAGSPKDYAHYIEVLGALKTPKGARILDYGCSWGYGSWQLREAGFHVTGYEISEPRCLYAKEKLGIQAYSQWEEVPDGPYDIFFSAHVLEHVPSVSEVILKARQKLTPGGLWLAFTPNGSSAYRKAQPEIWNRLWGMVHPNFPDDQFYQEAFEQPLLASNPYNFGDIRERWQERIGGVSGKLDGEELMVAVKIG